MSRKKRKNTQQAWISKTIYLNKHIPNFQNFQLTVKTINNDIVKITIVNTSNKILEFMFESYALSGKGKKQVEQCQAGQRKILKLCLGSYFDIFYR